MRRFRFVGDPKEYQWDVLPVVGKIYDGDFMWTYKGEIAGNPLQKWWNEEPENGDWQEVFDEPKPLHKDTDLGYYAGLAMLGAITRGIPLSGKECIDAAKELIKQLDSLSDDTAPH